MRCTAIGVVEILERAPVVADGLVARVQFEQNLVGVRGGLTDPFALSTDAFGECGQGAVELGRVDRVQYDNNVLEHRIDFGADVARLQHLTGRKPLRAGIAGINQIDELRTEDRGGPDLRFNVRGNVLDLVRVDLQLQDHRLLAAR